MSTSTTHESKGDSIAANRIIQSSIISAVAACIGHQPTCLLPRANTVQFHPGCPADGTWLRDSALAGLDGHYGHYSCSELAQGCCFTALQGITERAVTIFCVIAVVFLLLSFGAIFSQPVALNIQVMLATLHTITAVVITYVLTIWRHDHETP